MEITSRGVHFAVFLSFPSAVDSPVRASSLLCRGCRRKEESFQDLLFTHSLRSPWTGSPGLKRAALFTEGVGLRPVSLGPLRIR